MYTVVDIETTGFSARDHHITEIAAAKIRHGAIIESYQTLVNPQARIPSFITNLTGIDNELVKNAPTIKQVLPSFVHFLGEDVFVAHNATFDFKFLEYKLEGNLANQRLCTRKLANRLFPQLSRKRLHLNIQNAQAHRAMADVRATAAVFDAMLNILRSKGISNVYEVLKFEKSKITRL